MTAVFVLAVNVTTCTSDGSSVYTCCKCNSIFRHVPVMAAVFVLAVNVTRESERERDLKIHSMLYIKRESIKNTFHVVYQWSLAVLAL
ncbi:hypothetical protein KUTeg_023816 [Tegillarca granosa]|uniref:Secreted protein n=1 Tax=Tegillarca granosa TaxID=220873 RepID=A0ABQ9E7K6_TEGGR|nr:hypothetical protein KUTeg_023816 [Tegillarca granosa]